MAKYEFCPRCDANLTLQKGYNRELPYWICKGCGETLINPEIDVEDDIVWICDQCGSMLNIQDGFHRECREWACRECGFVNKIDRSELYRSEDEFQATLHDPYKGLTDEDALALSLYRDLENVAGREYIFLTEHRDSGMRYVKKFLQIYDKSIYEYLQKHPIAHMPRIEAVYEGSHCLIVVEEYIAGKTIAEVLDTGAMAPEEAIRIATNLCGILRELHTLPAPIIHRDIKPSNVMITPEGEIILLDMNAAKWYDPEKTDDTRYMGTPYFAAPEQAGYGFTASSEKTDIYAIGMLLNVMITGKLPKQKRAEGTVWKIIERCISLNAEDRYTAEELADALKSVEESG